MDLFKNAKVVKLRSHLDKYLVADDDRESVRQSRNDSSSKSRWYVEVVPERNVVRLKSCHGKYLTVSDAPFLLGMTGKKVVQSSSPPPSELKSAPMIEWTPKRDGFQVKLTMLMVTREGVEEKYLRANGGTPPWRNMVTCDNPFVGGTKSWILWDVIPVVVHEFDEIKDYLSKIYSFSNSVKSDDVSSLESESPMSVISCFSPKFSLRQMGIDFFHNAKSVRLRGRHGKYLVAHEDEESVIQDRNGTSKTARWTVEFSADSPNIIRLKSCFNRYLTASNQAFLLGWTGKKVLQTQPQSIDSSVEWEPIRDGNFIKLKTRYGLFLRANGGLPPWRNSVTHDIPHRTATQDWVLWDVDITGIIEKTPVAELSSALDHHSDSFGSDLSSPTFSVSMKSLTFSRQESNDSPGSLQSKSEGRTIYYQIIGEESDGDEATEEYSFTFKGNGVEELTRKLEEETGMKDIIVCTRSPMNQKLYPLRLQLPPRNANMHVVVVPSSSTERGDFAH